MKKRKRLMKIAVNYLLYLNYNCLKREYGSSYRIPFSYSCCLQNVCLQEHHPALYSHLLLSEKLYHHLLEIDQAANERLAQLMPRMAKSAGITEQLKATEQMKWVGLMNVVKAQMEEIIFLE